MDETQPADGLDGEEGQAQPLPKPLILEMSPSLLATVHRIVGSSGHLERVRGISGQAVRAAAIKARMSSRSPGSFARHMSQRREALEREDATRILPMREAIGAKWPGACSENLPPDTFHRLTERAERSLLEDAARADDATSDPAKAVSRKYAHSILSFADAMASAEASTEHAGPTLGLTLLEMTSSYMVLVEKELAKVSNPGAYLAGRQLLTDAIGMAVDAFNVAALEETEGQLPEI